MYMYLVGCDDSEVNRGTFSLMYSGVFTYFRIYVPPT